MMIKAMTSLIALATAASAAPALSQTFDFEGTRENVNPLTPPGGRCVPPYFNTVNIAPGQLSSTGTSNLGSFTSTQSHCITSPPPTSVVDGEFRYTFRGGDWIEGTYSGSVAASATPGQFIGTENLIVTGGTGRFTGATGSITSSGTLFFANGNGNFSGLVDGTINAGATIAGPNAVALGVPAAAEGEYATAIGTFSYAPGDRATAVGAFAEATGAGATAVGDSAYAPGASAIAVGQQAEATGELSMGVG
jgi:hypothetical protein